MTWPAVLAWILIFAGMVPRSPLFLLYLFFGFGAFGSLNLLGEGGGVNVLPQASCAVFLVCKILLSESQLSRALDIAIDPGKLGLLFAYTVFVLFSAYVMPRFFAHMVVVVDLNSLIPWPILLEPSTSNVSQSVYSALSFGIVLVFSLAGGNASFRRHYMQALLGGGLLLIATGLADMTMAAAGLADLLQPFRTANYTLLTSHEILGSKRIVGLMPEASGFGPPCVFAATSLALLRPCFENVRLHDYLVPLAIVGLLAMAALSESTTAYAGLVVFAAVFGANWLRRTLAPDAPERDGLKSEAIFVFTAALVLLGTVILMPHALDFAYDMIDSVLFKKSGSDSEIERSSWTRVAMQAFFATDGLGVGLGSARTSNWFAAVLSNTGVIGAAFLGWFFLRLYFLRYRGADPRKSEFLTALKLSLVPWFAMAWGSWPTADFGLGVASTLGMISSLTASGGMSSIRSGVTVSRQIRARSPPQST